MDTKLFRITKDDIDKVKFIINSTLPVSYPQSFYQRLGRNFTSDRILLLNNDLISSPRKVHWYDGILPE